MYGLLRMAASSWIGIKRITRSQELQIITAFKLQLKAGDKFFTVPDIFQLIPQINIHNIIVGLHFQRKECDVISSVITSRTVTDAHLHSRGEPSPVVNTRGDRSRRSSRSIAAMIASCKQYISETSKTSVSKHDETML